MKKVIFLILKILGGLALFIVLAIFGSFLYLDYWLGEKEKKILSSSKFDQKLWMEARSNNENEEIRWHHKLNCTRGHMYNDLVTNYLKKDMSKQEIFDLLGKPIYGAKYPNNKNWQNCLEYSLGSCHAWVGGSGRTLLICMRDNQIIDFFVGSGNDEREHFKID